MSKIFTRNNLSLLLIILIIGTLLYLIYRRFTRKHMTQKVKEGFENQECPDILVQKGKHIFLHRSKAPEVPGINPIKFNNLEDYVEYFEWQRSQGKKCPILYLQNSFDAQGNLVLCQHGDRRLAIIENESNLNPSFTTLIDNYEGKKLNSPNDLVFSKTGEIYFTDPAFGFFDLNTFEILETPLRELDFFGVYKFDTQSKILSLVTDTVDLPNGIGLSPDEKTLYVNKMGMLDQNPKVLKINLEDLSSEVLFDGKELSDKYEGNFDGMVIHSSGNIFTSGPGGLLIISPQGKLLAKINFGHITNCTLDAKEEFLYVTGFLNNPKVFRLKLKT